MSHPKPRSQSLPSPKQPRWANRCNGPRHVCMINHHSALVSFGKGKTPTPLPERAADMARCYVLQHICTGPSLRANVSELGW
jgi:hypothetical protein